MTLVRGYGFLGALGALLLSSCTPSADLEAERWSLLEADQAYTTAMDAGDVEGIVSLYAPDATRHPPGGESAGGPESIRAFAEGVAATPGFALSAWPISLDVSADATAGFTLNHVRLTVAGEDGAPVVQWLRDAHYWRRDEAGAWRIVEDIWHVMEVEPSVRALLAGPGLTVASLGFVDLLGDAVRFDLGADTGLPDAVPPGAQVPVELFAVTWDGGEAGSSTRLVIASADTQGPWFLLDQVVEAVAPDGGGIATDGLGFEEDRPGEPLALVVHQLESPGRDDGARMPGPPAALRWRVVDGRFEPAGG